MPFLIDEVLGLSTFGKSLCIGQGVWGMCSENSRSSNRGLSSDGVRWDRIRWGRGFLYITNEKPDEQLPFESHQVYDPHHLTYL